MNNKKMFLGYNKYIKQLFCNYISNYFMIKTRL